VFAVPFCLCYLPGLYTGPQWIYMFPMIARGDEQDGIAAMKASMAKAKAEGFVAHLIRFILIGIVGGIGSVACGIGGLITMPIAVIAFDAAYDDFKAQG
jgi:uncharacterized membrane protein